MSDAADHYEAARQWLSRAEGVFNSGNDLSVVLAAAKLAEVHVKLGDRAAALAEGGDDRG